MASNYLNPGKFELRSSSLRMAPDLIIIGVMRGGTTSLYNYLGLHPCFARASTKELDFFDDEFGKGFAWYRAHFPLVWKKLSQRITRRGPLITGEATPYYMFHPLAPKRIAAHLPRVKLIALLRNPVERAYSHYQLMVRRGLEPLTFEAALDQEQERLEGEAERIVKEAGYVSPNHKRYSYVARGIYADQLPVWQNLFPRDRLLVLQSEKLYQDPQAVLDQICAFTKIPRWKVPGQIKTNDFPYPPMSPATRKRLVDCFTPHNHRLTELLGVDWQWE